MQIQLIMIYKFYSIGNQRRNEETAQCLSKNVVLFKTKIDTEKNKKKRITKTKKKRKRRA